MNISNDKASSLLSMSATEANTSCSSDLTGDKSKTLDKDDIVWCKVGKYPWWPGKITNIKPVKAHDSKYEITFFGTKDISKNVASNNVQPFNCTKKSKFSEHSNPKSIEIFNSAIREAEEEVSKKVLSNSMDDELKLIKAKEIENSVDIKSSSATRNSRSQAIFSKNTNEAMDESLSKTKRRSKSAKTITEENGKNDKLITESEVTTPIKRRYNRRHSLANPVMIKPIVLQETKPIESKKSRKRKSLCISDMKNVSLPLSSNTPQMPDSKLTKKTQKGSQNGTVSSDIKKVTEPNTSELNALPNVNINKDTSLKSEKHVDDKENISVPKKRGRPPLNKSSSESTSKIKFNENSLNKTMQNTSNENKKAEKAKSFKRRHSLTTISTENTIDSKKIKNKHMKLNSKDENDESSMEHETIHEVTSTKKKANKAELAKAQVKGEQLKNSQTRENESKVIKEKEEVTLMKKISNKAELKKAQVKEEESKVAIEVDSKSETIATTNISRNNKRKSLLNSSIQLPVERSIKKAKLKDAHEALNKSLSSLENIFPNKKSTNDDVEVENGISHSQADKPKRMTAINASLNFSTKRPKSQKEIEKSKSKETLSRLNIEDKFKYLEEKEKENEIIKKAFEETKEANELILKEKKKNKKNKMKSLVEESTQNDTEKENDSLNSINKSRDFRLNSNETLPDLNLCESNKFKIEDAENANPFTSKAFGDSTFTSSDDDLESQHETETSLKTTTELERVEKINFNQNKKIHDNISFIINSNRILMKTQYNIIKYAIEQLKEDYKKQPHKSKNKDLVISIYDISDNVENKLLWKSNFLDNEDTFYDITFLNSFEDIFKNEIIFSFVPFSESRSIFYADDELIPKSILECLNESEKYEENLMQYSKSIKENKFIQLIPLSEENIMYHDFFKELDSIFIEAPILNLSNDRTDDYNSQEIRQNMVIAAYCLDKNVFESIKHLFYAIVPENQIVLTNMCYAPSRGIKLFQNSKSNPTVEEVLCGLMPGLD